jgi:hypothetical protein
MLLLCDFFYYSFFWRGSQVDMNSVQDIRQELVKLHDRVRTTKPSPMKTPASTNK